MEDLFFCAQLSDSPNALIPSSMVEKFSASFSPTPKWDGTFRTLNIQQGVEEPKKERTKKVIDKVLKENQAKTARRTKLKKGTLIEAEVQLENVLEPKGVEEENDVDDDVTLGVMLQHEKSVSQSSTRGRRQRPALIKLVKKASKKSVFIGSKMKQWEVPMEEGPDVATK
ncbi:hypothetical protein HAX54_008016 [Datura stramonium]|uniref:Uncharacterized protein n=1 Tax=Datura stramonium TaxID=4076 RepID=A0ABS8TCP3_DATST|nr:hypothetical protein [Datura stramonium]